METVVETGIKSGVAASRMPQLSYYSSPSIFFVSYYDNIKIITNTLKNITRNTAITNFYDIIKIFSKLNDNIRNTAI
jgi:hypothetical protein